MTYQEENKELLKLFEPLRVADVRDGMDWMGYHHYGTMDKNIRPLWRTKMVGIARTARYLPYEGPAPLCRGDEYTQWSNWYYNNVAIYPWIEEIEEGDVIVLDMSGVELPEQEKASSASLEAQLFEELVALLVFRQDHRDGHSGASFPQGSMVFKCSMVSRMRSRSFAPRGRRSTSISPAMRFLAPMKIPSR